MSCEAHTKHDRTHTKEQHKQNCLENISEWQISAQLTFDSARQRRLLSILRTEGDAVATFSGWDRGLKPKLSIKCLPSNFSSYNIEIGKQVPAERYEATVTIQRVMKLYRLAGPHSRYWGLGWVDDQLAQSLVEPLRRSYEDMGCFEHTSKISKAVRSWLASSFRKIANQDMIPPTKGDSLGEQSEFFLRLPITFESQHGNSTCVKLHINFEPQSTTVAPDPALHKYVPSIQELENAELWVEKHAGENVSVMSGSTVNGGQAPTPQESPTLYATEEGATEDGQGRIVPLYLTADAAFFRMGPTELLETELPEELDL